MTAPMTAVPAATAEVHFHRVFPFAECAWELTTDSHPLAANFGSAFPESEGQTDTLFRLDLQSSDGEEELWTSPYFRARDHMVLAAFSSADVMIFDLLGRRGLGTISRALAENRDYWRRVIVPALVGLASPSAGIAPLHCATLVRNGMGLHISGLSGAGKSTLSYALAQCGFQLLSDDWTYFTRGPNGLQAAGLPVPIKLLPDTRRFFPELGAHGITRSLNGELAYEIGTASSLSPSRIYTCSPRRLLFYRREPRSSPRWTRLTPAQVEAQFRPALERVPICLAPARESQHAIIAELAKIPAYSLVCDGSPQQIAAWIDEWMDSDAGAAATEDISPPPHFEIPDLMLRFPPAPLLSIHSSTGQVRIETDILSVHQYSSELARQLMNRHGDNLHCTFIEDRADWPAVAGTLGQFSYRFLPEVGCMIIDRNSGCLVSFASSAAASLESMTELIAPVSSRQPGFRSAKTGKTS
jgi:hypothetical protein